jgi:hypothetical protein
MQTWITKYCHIKQNKIILNDNIILEDASAKFGEFIRVAYKFAGMSYPKFYKMDNPCKLALVAAELLLKDTSVIEQYGKDNVGLVFQNASSTIDTDSEYQLTINDRGNYFPSPSVFVYTLPNIMLGEICIKHKIFGENALMIVPRFDANALSKHLAALFDEKRIKCCIAGWVEQHNDYYDAFVFLAESVENNQNGICLINTSQQLENTYSQLNN